LYDDGMGTELHQVGRRERKKAMTRASILQAAQELFLERGFDAVSVREIADQADVSPTTVFAHFPQKEALLFHEEDAQRERLVAAVRERPDGLSISEALKAYYRSEFVAMWSGEEAPLRRRVMSLMEATPALQEEALAAAITEELGLARPSDDIRIYARFALQIQLLVTSDTDPMLDAGFRILDQGWSEHHPAPDDRGSEVTESVGG
jgi:AcrR family transcriptional regulator